MALPIAFVLPGPSAMKNFARYYAACDVFALPSTGEGFGIVFLEAMAQGKPCVGARAGGVPDAIVDSVTGRLVNPGDTHDLMKALRDLFSNPEERRRLGAAGRARFESEFAYPHFRRRVEALVSPRRVSSNWSPRRGASHDSRTTPTMISDAGRFTRRKMRSGTSPLTIWMYFMVMCLVGFPVLRLFALRDAAARTTDPGLSASAFMHPPGDHAFDQQRIRIAGVSDY